MFPHSENVYYIDSGQKQSSKILQPSDMCNRDNNSLQTSAVSFAYQSDRENRKDDYKTQLDDQITENIKLRKQLLEEIERNKGNDYQDLKNEMKVCAQRLNDEWNKKYNDQLDRFTQIFNKKDHEIGNLNKFIRQLEIENKLLTKERNEKPKDNSLEYKINILLNENEKLNQILQERISQVERMKIQSDLKEVEFKQQIDRYEQTLAEKTNLFAKEKQSIEKVHTQTLYNHKNEFVKQIQCLNAQNTQLSALLCEQKAKLEYLELQLDNNNEQLESERQQINYKQGELTELQHKLEIKEKEYQEVVVKFNELEKKLVSQNAQLQQIEQQIDDNNHYQSVYEQMQTFFEEQYKSKENQLKQSYDQEKTDLMEQLNENQNFISELQNHLTDIHNQITKFKQEKMSLKQQNQELQNKLQEYTQNKNDYSLPSFNNTTLDSSFDIKKNTNNMNCINQLKQYSLTQNQKTYTQQFQQKLKKIRQEVSPKRFDLDSFGNKDRSISCLEMVKNEYHLEDEDEEEDDVNPIEQFKMWKQQMTDRH